MSASSGCGEFEFIEKIFHARQFAGYGAENFFIDSITKKRGMHEDLLG
jgi:hypothetical protein